MKNVTNSLRLIGFVFLAIIPIGMAAQTDPVDRQSPGTRPPTAQTPAMPTDEEQARQDRQDRLDRQGQRPGDREVLDRGREEQPKVIPQIPLPPEPDIEFQNFVAASLGYRLSIFGQDLFRSVPST
ncbi:MAG TPA: hypothetical protein VEW69_11095, partial [Alphaproteobacteria bacterium]|nr:hypothetical protein [Alphaproteobacteria bacterium]